MPKNIDGDPPISHAIADGSADFAETVLPCIGGADRAQAHITVHFGALYVLQIAHRRGLRPAQATSCRSLWASWMQSSSNFMKSHVIALQ
jgi:hypothetical protein